MKKYDNYKDSGIEWIGEIPEHWEVNRLRNIADSIKTGSTPPSEEIQYFEPKDINWYGPGDFDDLILYEAKRKISDLAIEDNKCKLFPSNSILLIGIGATVGKVGIVSEASASNQQINAIVLKKEYNSKYYTYFISTIKEIIVMEASSATLPIFNQTQTKNIVLPVPQILEQTAIANYLDHKTTQIDTLIAKKQQFISLLQEERTAVINQAVTKGLDLNVPLKDSGIEWLGEIPEHWEVKQVRYLLEEGKDGIKIGPFGSSLKLDFMTDKGYKVYGQENVIKNDFTKGTKYIDESKYKEMVNYTISSGDIVITMMGTAGLAKVVPNDFEPGIMDSHLTRIRVNKSKFSNRLFELLINDSYLIKSQVQFHSKGSIMGGLNSSIIKSFILPTPDIDEQVKILAFIEKSILYNQEIMNKTKQEIELLKEYKTALISQVVTGKVDVRDVVLN